MKRLNVAHLGYDSYDLWPGVKAEDDQDTAGKSVTNFRYFKRGYIHSGIN